MRWKARWISFQEYSNAMGRPWGQLVGCLVFASSNSNHSIRCGSRGVLTLIAAWQAIEAAMRGPQRPQGPHSRGLARICGSDWSMTCAKHLLQGRSLQAHRRRLDRKYLRAKGFHFKSVALQLLGNRGENHHLRMASAPPGWASVSAGAAHFLPGGRAEFFQKARAHVPHADR